MVSRTSHFRKFASVSVCGIAMALLLCLNIAMAQDISETQTLISRLEVRSTSSGEEVWIIGNQPLAHSAFLLSEPYRLVVDIPDAALGIEATQLEGDYQFIDHVTSRKFAEANRQIVRIEMVMKDEHPYTITSAENSLKIAFGEVKIGNAREAAEDEQTGDWTVPQVAASGEDLMKATQVYGLQSPTVYKGKPIFLDLKDADILDIFRLIAEVSGFNVVVDPDVADELLFAWTMFLGIRLWKLS